MVLQAAGSMRAAGLMEFSSSQFKALQSLHGACLLFFKGVKFQLLTVADL